MRVRATVESAQAPRPRRGTFSRRCGADCAAQCLGPPPLSRIPGAVARDLFAEDSAANLVAAVHCAEHLAIADAGGRGPCIDRDLDPRRHRDRPNPPVLSEEVNNAPATVPQLNVPDGKRRNLRPPKTTAQKNGEDRPIAAQAAGTRKSRSKRPCCEPCSMPHTSGVVLR